MLRQVNVFIENKKGHLSKAIAAISDGGINMDAFFIADTIDFGVARIFCSDPDSALKVLTDAGFRSSVVDVFAVKIENKTGALSRLLSTLEQDDISIEYSYCYPVSNQDWAVFVFKSNSADTASVLDSNGFDQIVEI